MSLEHWETYYRSGALATCPTGPDSRYTLELHEVWTALFRELPDGARILDVGTGNGAIALIARETAVALGRRFEIHGTDLAQIDPVRHVRDGARLFSGIEFHAGVATERLPFASESFDAVSGQYALEYTAVDDSLREVLRILKRGGRAQFVLHHLDSLIVGNGRESLRQTDLVLNDTKIYRKLRRHLEAARRSPTSARRARQELAEALTVLRGAAYCAHSALILRVTVDAVLKLLDAARRLTPAALEREIAGVEGALRASARRLRDLVTCALSDEGMARIATAAHAAGFARCAYEAQHHAGGNLVGWRLSLAKA